MVKSSDAPVIIMIWNLIYFLDTETGEVYAMKIMQFTNAEEGIPSTAIREIALLKSLDHPNVIKLHKIINEDNALHLVFDNGDKDLKRHMDELGGSIEDIRSVKAILY